MKITLGMMLIDEQLTVRASVGEWRNAMLDLIFNTFGALMFVVAKRLKG